MGAHFCSHPERLELPKTIHRQRRKTEVSQPINGCAAQHWGQLLMFEGKSCSHGRAFTKWLADLLRHGLLQASFIPPAPIRELRDLTRYRKTLVQERAQEVNRLHKVLETANVKLAAVATDVLGKSGRAMLEAIMSGTTDAEILAELAYGKLRKKLPQLQEALDGRVQAHHRILLKHILAHIAFLEETLEQLQHDIEERLCPFEEAMTLLMSIPGIQALAAATILGEIGVDMTRFPSANHLASWAGVCPGNKQSGGKRLSGRVTPGNATLKALLIEVVWVISHMRGPNIFTPRFPR